MNFEFSEEQEAIRELAREILEAEATIDRVKAVEATPEWMDESLWQKLAESNLLGIAVPEELGGMGMGFVELCVLLEEIGRVVAPTPALASLVLAGLPLVEFGSPEQKAEWLPKLATGAAILSAALEDAGSGDPSTPATRARADGEGFTLDGAKRNVPFARKAARILVPASLDAGGVGLFLVDPKAKGVALIESRTSTGEPLFDLELSGVSVASDALLGGPDLGGPSLGGPGPGGADLDGSAVTSWILDRALAALASLQMGVSDKAIEITAGYTREREQFNVPIGSFQAVQHRMADSFIDLAAMRWTAWRAVWSLSEGRSASREARVAKFWAAEGGSRIASACIHLHGGLGSDVDYPIHRYFIWSKALELRLGGATPQLVRLGRDMARNGPFPPEVA